MSKIIVLDPGHGGSDPGACGNNLQEAAITLAICKLMEPKLTSHGFTVKFTRTTDKYVGLTERAVIANNIDADLFVSIHCNSLNAASHGTECYTHPNGDSNTDKLSANVSSRLASVLGIINRGAKEANYAVLRETVMPAILVETAFISNPTEAVLLKTKQQAIADGIVSEILKHYGISEKVTITIPTTPSTTAPSTSALSTTFYRVVVGSFIDKTKASAVEAKLDKAGYSAFLDAFKKDGKTYYRVIAASLSVKASAEKVKSELEKAGYTGLFLTTFTKKATVVTPIVETKTVTKKYINLPASDPTWSVYALKDQPVAGNAYGKLTPSVYGGLSYEILGNPMKDVYTIKTSTFGKVNIYGAASTGATITTSPKH